MSDSTCNQIESAVEAGANGAHIDTRITEIEGVPVGYVGGAEPKFQVLSAVLDISDGRADAPRRRRGTAVHHEVGSFVEFVNRHKSPASVCFADGPNVKVTAVLNYQPAGPDVAAWGDHRAVYSCPLSDQWRAWNAAADKPMSQEAFAQFLEDHLDDIRSADGFPAAASMVELARNLVIRSKGVFERKINPTTGEGIMVCKDEHEESSTRIPRAFLLGIPVFEAGAPYAVEARLRFTMAGGRPAFAFALYRAREILRDAFGEVRARVAKETSLPMFAGEPETQS